MVFFLLSSVPLWAAPVLYKGTLEVKATSGGACTGKEVGKVMELELVLDQSATGVTGYFSGADIATGQFSGKDAGSLAVVYPFAEQELPEGHRLKLLLNGDSASGTLHERHLAATVDNCNYDLAQLKLTLAGDDANTAWKTVEARFNASLARSQGQALYRQKKYAEAIPLYEKALTLREEADGKTAEAVGWFLNGLVRAYGNAGRLEEARKMLDDGVKRFHGVEVGKALAETDKWLIDLPETTLADRYFSQGRDLEDKQSYAEAIPLYQKALEIAQRLRPHDVADIMAQLASCHMELQQWGKAELYYRETVDLKEKEYGPESIKLATSLNSLAVLYYTTGRYAEAEPLFTRALAIREMVLGPEHPGTSTSLSNLAALYQATGRYADAEPLHKRALAIIEKALGPEHPDTASILNSQAVLYYATSRYTDVEPLFKRALEIREKVLGPEHPDTATSLNNLALLYKTTGRYTDAESLYRRALSIREKVFGPEHAETAISLNNLATLYDTIGRYAEAEPLYRRALSIREKVFGPEHAETAASLNNLAALYQTTGRYADAEPLYKHALSIREKALGPEHPDTAASLSNLAVLYYTTGRYADAEPLFKHALSIREKVLGPKHPDTADSLNNLAALYDTTGRYANAEPLYRRALSIREKVFGPEHAETAAALHNLAVLYTTTGRYADAEPLYKRALAIAADTGNPELHWKVNNCYGQSLEKQQNPTAAVFFLKQAVNTIQSLRQNVAKLGKNVLNSFTGTVEENYKHLANLLIEQGRLAEAQQVLAMLKEEEYFQYVQRSAADASKLNTTASFTPAEEPWQQEYEALSAGAAELGKELGELRELQKKGFIRVEEKKRLAVLEEENKKQTAAFNAFLERLIKGLREDARKLAEDAREQRLEELGQKGLAKTAALRSTLKALGEGSVVLHYLIMDDRLHILLTTPDMQLARQSAITATELNKKIFAFREQLKNPHSDPLILARELYGILIAPVAKELQESKAWTLMLSLDGALRYLPFAALYDGKGYLVSRYRTVMYSEVAKDKVALPAASTWQVAALGTSAEWPGFSPLPSVPGELSGIIRSDAGGVIPGEIHLDKQFTEVALQEAAARKPVLHIASHFRFVPGTDTDSFLLLGDGSRLTLAQVKGGSYFQESELLTLSACETAMGSSGKGAEIEGFGALAMGQGAKAVIATLWPVADESTALLMREFYRQHEGKLTKVEALRQAQLRLLTGEIRPGGAASPADRGGISLRKPANEGTTETAKATAPYAHPYYWAPFILMGNWK
ncbi:tetratricopeptide repeat protein [Geobacter hydrogenophilus]|nr:tetratricopeptide repeat protein [Geobacter hydrogenophilus]